MGAPRRRRRVSEFRLIRARETIGYDGRDVEMATCEVCGRDDDSSFEIVKDGARHTFDSFECAIHGLAAECAHCGCRVIGHAVEEGGRLFCCAHCAAAVAVSEMT